MNTPKIRFKGYTDAWEQRKVSEIADYIDGNYGEKYPKDNEFIDEGIPFFTSAVTGADGVFNKENVKYISEEKNSILLKAQSRGGDLLLTNRGASMGVIAEIPQEYGLVNIGPQLTRIRGKKGVAFNKFLLSNLQTSKNSRKLTSMNAGSAMPFIGLSGLGSFELQLPSFEEQKQIGGFFSDLDNLITLHQRKCDRLNAVKKYMLQKMFPQNGAKAPEIRFKGFTGDWEQRKLEDVVEFLDTMRKPLEGAKRIPGPYPYYGASGIVDYINDYIFDEELILLSEDGANITDRNYPVCFMAAGKYWVNNHAHVLKTKPGNENNFICNSLERKDYKQYNTGMAMPKLNQDVCKKIPVGCPSYEEQKKIGDYFRNLDNLITLNQRKVDSLNELKKFMLQNMFP